MLVSHTYCAPLSLHSSWAGGSGVQQNILQLLGAQSCIIPAGDSYRFVPNDLCSVYLVRLSLTTYYEYRTSSVQSQLLELQKQRDSTIEKLKAATKYNDTQDLLKKYGGTPTSRTKAAEPSERNTTPKQGGVPKDGSRTFVPPPTANIPGRNGPVTFTNTPQRSAPQVRSPSGQDSYPASVATPHTQGPVSPQGVSAEFAPNAFSAAPQYSQANERSRWYDRITDALLGEDETLPRARLALICEKCRLVNGQAPPGVRRLEDVGKWRCGGCGAMKYVFFIPRDIFASGFNSMRPFLFLAVKSFAWRGDTDFQITFSGEESEAKKIVASIKQQASSKAGRSEQGERDELEAIDHNINREDAPTFQDDGHESEITQYSSESSDSTQGLEAKTAKPVEAENPRRRSSRSKKGSKKVS